ncbi:DUF1003 domain-containing protein [Sinorhizobium mexicanum]|uniref:DUF1003 domain-containing protein n=1 Tax=Sinorhizobium mexicanum TaxID=375549 RepID=A0A859QUA4_9HYPH|nr:DUF1003 domain-containing protein [Sinorhizobium mexicanum]
MAVAPLLATSSDRQVRDGSLSVGQAWRRGVGTTFLFILLNLALSFQAAHSAPIIMMSQNGLAW